VQEIEKRQHSLIMTIEIIEKPIEGQVV